HDSVFLDKVLRHVLTSKKYDELFNTDYPDHQIEIDLQIRVSELSGFTTVVGVTCSGTEIVDFDSIEPRETNSPATDVCIKIGDTCIVFEFKRTGENCAAQMKSQVSKISADDKSAVRNYVDFSWNRIIATLLTGASMQKQLNAENPFSRDFIRFLEGFPADWFPSRRLVNIPFPNELVDHDSNFRLLHRRLNQIKAQLYGEEGTVEYSGTFNRLAIKAEFGWINEINCRPEILGPKKFLAVVLHLGDTKGQGEVLFRKRPHGLLESLTINEFVTVVQPYIKLSSLYAAGRLWLIPNQAEARQTHTREFFDKFAGRWARDRWDELSKGLESYIDGWKGKTIVPNMGPRAHWEERFQHTRQTGLLLSVGFYLRVLLPYQVCQQADDRDIEPRLVSILRKVISELRERIDNETYNEV
ncbi:MAG: hypothetical protein IPM25_08160, partial [Chloracidobacterium sp.]|nr:hypothetical protein [Chloracidobacterium sp.]